MRDNHHPVRRFADQMSNERTDEQPGCSPPPSSQEGVASSVDLQQMTTAQHEPMLDDDPDASHVQYASASSHGMRHFYNSNRSRRNTRNLDEEFNRLRIKGAQTRPSHLAPVDPPAAYVDKTALPPPPVQPLLQPQPLYPHGAAPQFVPIPAQGGAVALPVYWLNGTANPQQYLLFTTTAQQMCALVPDALVRQQYVAPQEAAEQPFHFVPVISEMVGPMFESPIWIGPAGAPAAFQGSPDEQLNSGYNLQSTCKECLFVPVNVAQQYNVGECGLSAGCQLCPPEQAIRPPWTPYGQAVSAPTGPPDADFGNVADGGGGDGCLLEQPQFLGIEECCATTVESVTEEVSEKLPPTGRVDAAVQWCKKSDHSDRSRSPRSCRRPTGASNELDFSHFEREQIEFGIASPICRSGDKRSSGSELDLAAEKEPNSSPSSMLPAADSRAMSPWSSNASTNDSLSCSLATTGCQSGDGHKNNWPERRLYSRVFYNRARRRAADSSVGRESQSPQHAPSPCSPKPPIRWRKVHDHNQGQRRFSLDYSSATGRTADTYNGTRDRFARNLTPNERSRRANTRFNL